MGSLRALDLQVAPHQGPQSQALVCVALEQPYEDGSQMGVDLEAISLTGCPCPSFPVTTGSKLDDLPNPPTSLHSQRSSLRRVAAV